MVAIWAEDEHRLGLLPVVRRTWAPRGRRPTAWGQRRYQWLYVYAFVRPTTGQSWWCLLPTVSTETMTAALAAFAADEGIDASRRAVLVLDGAGWHTSGRLIVPDGIDLVFLPPASPELQPVERVWALVDEPVANQTFADLDALEAVLVTRCQTLRSAQRIIKAHTRFHWWARERRRRKAQ
jgi:transposase